MSQKLHVGKNSTATATPNGGAFSPQWSSSDPSVCQCVPPTTDFNVRLQPLSPGTFILTCTAQTETGSISKDLTLDVVPPIATSLAITVVEDP